ncbi:cytoplasmic protein [Acinetobacter towneri]|uniref:cytoplasmic protein n=1 Tax=Acinetobacter towneri TaxID=202956 RepID=UPI002574B3A4|nr:cytoplasmic protein [Acinetobacter towneri]
MSKISEIYHYSSQHRALLQQSECCGCFCCLETFAYSEIEDWCDDEQTAICPHCGIDAVLGSALVEALTPELLKAMHQAYFE